MECYEQAITAGASNGGLYEIDDPNYFEWWYSAKVKKSVEIAFA